MPKSRRIQKYSLQKPSGRARVIIAGQHVYLGAHGSPESQELYGRKTAEWRAGTGISAPELIPPCDITVTMLVNAYAQVQRESCYHCNQFSATLPPSRKNLLQPLRRRQGERSHRPFGNVEGEFRVMQCAAGVEPKGVEQRRRGLHVRRQDLGRRCQHFKATRVVARMFVDGQSNFRVELR